jgi:hypothetical protein
VKVQVTRKIENGETVGITLTFSASQGGTIAIHENGLGHQIHDEERRVKYFVVPAMPDGTPTPLRMPEVRSEG